MPAIYRYAVDGGEVKVACTYSPEAMLRLLTQYIRVLGKGGAFRS